MKNIFTMVFISGFLSMPALGAGEPGPGWVFSKPIVLDSFYKGNTHTHSERSTDSVQPVEPLVNWYRDAGYNFLVLTDHDVSAIPGEFAALETGSYIVIAGEEVTSSGIHPLYGDERPVHVNSLCSNGTTVGGRLYASTKEAVRDSVERIINDSGGVPQVNHPKLKNALFWDDIDFAENARVLEIANQHPIVQNWEGAWGTSEDVWDQLLTNGHVMYGVASDDTHNLDPKYLSLPGKGWIQVDASNLTPANICSAIEAGTFYASTGVVISRIAVDLISFNIDIVPGPGETGADYTTTFIGRDGGLLKTQVGLSASYTIAGDYIYIRANVTGPSGKAWIQPQFIESDLDKDGTADSADNCTNVPNGPLIQDAGNNSQRDTDGDGYGNICDADLNNDNIVTVSDLLIMRNALNSANANADLNGDGLVTVADYLIARSLLNKPPGPSGIAP